MKENITLGIVTVLLAVVIMIFSLQLPVSDSFDEHKKTVTVSGNAQITAVADEVEVTLVVNTKGKTAKDAENANTELSQAVFNSLTTFKTETQSYSISEEYEWDIDTRVNTPIGYIARQSIIVTANAKEAGDIIDIVTRLGNVEIQYVAYKISDQKEAQIKEQALVVAIAQAKEKATILVESSGAKLGNIYEIEENNYFAQPVLAKSMALAADQAAQLEQPDIDISVQVQASYLIIN